MHLLKQAILSQEMRTLFVLPPRTTPLVPSFLLIRLLDPTGLIGLRETLLSDRSNKKEHTGDQYPGTHPLWKRCWAAMLRILSLWLCLAKF